MHDDVPGPEYKYEGYRIHEVIRIFFQFLFGLFDTFLVLPQGPLRFEQGRYLMTKSENEFQLMLWYPEGHEQVMKMAAELQGCPVPDVWKPSKTAL
jgi:hypothetical protein